MTSVIATTFTVVAALQLGQPGVIAVGVRAGVFTSVEAGRVHDLTMDTAR